MTTVKGYIQNVKDPKLQKIMRRLTSMIRKSLPSADEFVKWGVPYYSIDGRGIISMAEYTKNVNLYFLSGAELDSKLVEGTGKGMRHIKIGT